MKISFGNLISTKRLLTFRVRSVVQSVVQSVSLCVCVCVISMNMRWALHVALAVKNVIRIGFW